jgi:hypothetical protein
MKPTKKLNLKAEKISKLTNMNAVVGGLIDNTTKVSQFQTCGCDLTKDCSSKCIA